MDGSRFDAWTRRGFGLTVGSAAFSLIGLTPLHAVDARKKKRKKKRCKKLKQVCQPGSKKRKCCKNLTCDESVLLMGTHCCRKAQGACADLSECCKPSLCNTTDGRCCIPALGPCTEDADCCDEGGFCDDQSHLCDI